MGAWKGTPGPWRAVQGVLPPEDGHERLFIRPEVSEGWQIAQTFGPNGEANAKGIAAVPQLVEALAQAPVPAFTEPMETFRERSDAWLRDHYNPAMRAAGADL
jgi:hypothetical protein